MTYDAKRPERVVEHADDVGGVGVWSGCPERIAFLADDRSNSANVGGVGGRLSQESESLTQKAVAN